VPPDCMRRDKQAESNLLSALMTAREFLSRDTSYFVIVVMAAVTDLVDSRSRDLFPRTIHLDGCTGAHRITRLDTSSNVGVGFAERHSKAPHTSSLQS
jgi:hypothetical protein